MARRTSSASSAFREKRSSSGPEGLTVNGTRIDEPYVYRESGSDLEELTSWTLGSDEILVFGDHPIELF